MNPEEQRIAIAEVCGFKITRIEKELRTGNITRIWAETPDSWKGKDVRPWLPDFLTDLDAMHEAEILKDVYREQKWIEWLLLICLDAASLEMNKTDGWDWAVLCAGSSSTQRAEAFLRTFNKWEGEQ